MRAQVNRCLKQKTDYDRLYREHKQAESDYKKRSVEFDRQLKETRLDLAKTIDELDIKKEALSAEKTQAVE